jgi:hypothetical protein
MSDDVIDGSLPLAKRSHETYAWERSIATVPSIAAKRAGLSPRSGACSKLERNPAVRARIAHLAKEEERVLAAKRQRIEERLNLAAFVDLMEFVEVDEETGRFKFIDWRKIKEGELGQIISEFTFDGKTGELTKFKRDDALNALGQLRDMHGLKSVTKIAPTSPDGDGPPLAPITDEDRVRALENLLERQKTEAA